MIYQRNIVTCIILSIVTCGIYGLIWLYSLLTDLYRINGMQPKAGVDIILGFVTCGIYFLYLYYKMGEMESQAHRKYNLPPKDNSVIYLVLGIFTGSLAALAIIQDNLNNALGSAVNATLHPHDTPHYDNHNQ